MNLIVQDLAVGYRGREIASGISLQAAAGDCLLICGLNGSGKTTLLRTLAGLLPPVAGSFLANGRVVMVPTRIPRVKGFTVSEFLRLATGAAPADATRAIEQAGLPTLADRDISTLSDGQFQRACIATALCRRAAVILLDEPTAFLDYQAKEQILRACIATALCRRAAVILLDEPTAFLDYQAKEQILDLLPTLARDTGAAILFTSHDLDAARKIATSEYRLL